MRSIRSWATALLVAMTALLVAGCGVSLQSLPKPGVQTSDTYAVHATFGDVLNLPVDAQVREGPRVVGVVGAMDVEEYQADVELRIDDTFRIPVGTTAEVRFDNPLGDQYVELHLPEGEPGDYLAAGDRLSLAETSAAPTVEDTLAAFASVINGGGIGNIQQIAHELNLLFDGNQPQIRSFLDKLDVAATELAGGIEPIDEALDALALLGEELAKGSDELPEGLKSLSEAIGILAGQSDQFERLLTGLASFGREGNKAIAASGKQTVAAIKALVPVVRQIVRADAKITPALSNLRALEAQVPKVTEGGYANVSVTLPVVVSSRPSTVGAAAPLPGRPRAVTTLMTALGPLDVERTGAAR